MAHADKRSVSTDALETLGTIIGPNEGRDAIHLAVEPVTAAAMLHSGQHIGLLPDGTASHMATNHVGIVDPFLTAPVMKGERFWLVVYPRQITSLRHVWTHPAFADAPAAQSDKAASEAYLRAFAERLFSYHEPDEYDSRTRFDLLIEGAEHGGFGTDIECGDDCRPTSEFWDHFERYIGRKVAHRHDYFRCSC